MVSPVIESFDLHGAALPVALPPEMPEGLVKAAFLSAGGEAAWPPEIAVKVVDWLGSQGFAVLGAEVWIVTPNGKIGTFFQDSSGSGCIWTVAIHRNEQESWSSFVRRAAVSVSDSIRDLDVSDIRASGRALVNLTYTEEHG